MSKTPAPDTVKYAVLEALTHQPPGFVEHPKHAIIEYLQRYVAIPNTSKQRHRIHQSIIQMNKAGVLRQHGIIFTPGTNAASSGAAPVPIQIEVSPYVQALPHGKWRGIIMGQGKPKKKPTSNSEITEAAEQFLTDPRPPVIDMDPVELDRATNGKPMRRVGLELLASATDLARNIMPDTDEKYILINSLMMVEHIMELEVIFHDRYDAWVASGARKLPKHI